MKRLTGLLATLAFVLVMAISANALTLKEIEGEVMCTCPDNCGKVLINCSCKYSDEYRAGFAEQIRAGMTKQQILASWVDKYGEKGLSIPVKEGFNITAWVMPFLALFSALGLVFFLVRKWTASSPKHEEGVSKLEKISSEDKKILASLEDELKHFDE